MLVLILITLLASVVGTVSGFGISTFMIPILVTLYEVPQVLFFVAIIHLVNDVWKLILFHHGIRWPLIFYFGGAGLVTVMVGAWANVYIGSHPWFLQLLGLFLILYAALLLWRPTMHIGKNGLFGRKWSHRSSV